MQRIWVSLNFSNFIKSLPFSKNNLSAGTDRQCCEDVYKRQGHKNPDADCVGAALGIYRLSKTLGKSTYIVMEMCIRDSYGTDNYYS